MIKVPYDGDIGGQDMIDNLVRQAQDAEEGTCLAERDILVIRGQGTITVYTERYTIWEHSPEAQDD